MRPDADILIIGGGLAGLSLACQLIRRNMSGLQVVIVEPRPVYVRDRTWCYWAVHDHQFECCASASWTRACVSYGKEKTFISTPYPYTMITSDNLYRRALSLIEESKSIRILRPLHVLCIEETKRGLRVETENGALEAPLVFDTRPPADKDQLAGSGLIQTFTGIEVVADAPVFESSCVNIMDFAGDRDAIRFDYVLPISPRHALLEETVLNAAAVARPDACSIRERYEARTGAALRVTYTESGILPMNPRLGSGGPDARPAPQGVIPLGIRSGALRPSSGYGFLAIQRQTAAVASALEKFGSDGHRIRTAVPHRPAWMDWMDQVLLDVLKPSPERAPHIFTRLFRTCPPGPLIRFLSDTGDIGDALLVMAALASDAPPFLRAAIGHRAGLRRA